MPVSWKDDRRLIVSAEETSEMMEETSQMSEMVSEMMTSTKEEDGSFDKPKELNQNVPDIEPYGRKLTVQGRQMNIYEVGEGKKTLVVFPGLGEYSAKLTYSNLIKQLEKKYRLIFIEPFGTGLSDDTDSPRTIDNIVSEYHDAVKQLGIKDYTILAHSIGGIYALQYVKQYREEDNIQGFIGMDTSTPVQDGGMKIPQEAMTEDALYDSDYSTFDEKTKNDYLTLAKARLNTVAVWDEGDKVVENFGKVKDTKFPKGFKALYLLAKESQDSMEEFKKMIGVEASWDQQHLDLSEDPQDANAKILEGNHLLFWTAYEEIAHEIDAFMSGMEP